MAGHARYTAVLDACTLYSTVTADSLMSLAVAGLFAPKWTVRIKQEWMDAVVRGRPDLEGRLDYRRDMMREAPCLFHANRPLIPGEADPSRRRTGAPDGCGFNCHRRRFAVDARFQLCVESVDVLQQVVAQRGKRQQRVRSRRLLRELRLDRLQAFAKDVMISLVRRGRLRVAQGAEERFLVLEMTLATLNQFGQQVAKRLRRAELLDIVEQAIGDGHDFRMICIDFIDAVCA